MPHSGLNLGVPQSTGSGSWRQDPEGYNVSSLLERIPIIPPTFSSWISRKFVDASPGCFGSFLAGRLRWSTYRRGSLSRQNHPAHIFQGWALLEIPWKFRRPGSPPTSSVTAFRINPTTKAGHLVRTRCTDVVPCQYKLVISVITALKLLMVKRVTFSEAFQTSPMQLRTLPHGPFPTRWSFPLVVRRTFLLLSVPLEHLRICDRGRD